MKNLERRIDALEATGFDRSGVWHTIIRRSGQRFLDSIREYQARPHAKPFERGHNLMLINMIGVPPEGEKPGDPVHDADRPMVEELEAWMECGGERPTWLPVVD